MSDRLQFWLWFILTSIYFIFSMLDMGTVTVQALPEVWIRGHFEGLGFRGHGQNLRRGPMLGPPECMRMSADDTGDGFRKRDSVGNIREH
jgi:hypothetical protein